jgi:two-component system response regulator GlrR
LPAVWAATGDGFVLALYQGIVMKKRDGILVVDDDQDACDMLATALGQAGYAVETVTDGFEALAKLEHTAPDLILTDLQMPGMNGLELIQRIHAADPGAPIILMTGVPDTRDLCTGAEGYGAVGCLVKPINLDELLWAIDCALVLNRHTSPYLSVAIPTV